MIVARRIVGWLAVVAGLGVMVFNAYFLYDLWRSGFTGGGLYVALAFRGILFLAGAALVFFGFRRQQG